MLPATGAFSVLRVLRLVSMVPSMRGVVAALLSALPGMASTIGLMALVPYISAVMATKLFGVMAQSPYAWIFFVTYLLIATFMVLNLFIAVIVNAMQLQVTEDLKST